jgi:hypothetical protein
VNLIAYFDESGTHDGSVVTVMAAAMGNVAQWHRFQTELDRLKKGFGFNVFHANEFKHRQGEFAGWSPLKCISLIEGLAKATAEKLTEGAIFALENADYESSYKGGEKSRKFRPDTKYGLCFRICLLHLVSDCVRRYSSHKKFDMTRLNIVLERGHRHAGDAERVFNEEKKSLQRMGLDLLGSFGLGDKDKCDPLMVADFLAHTTYMWGAGDPPTDMQSLGDTPEKAGLTHLRINAAGLAEFKAALIQRLEARRPCPPRQASN